MPLQSDFWEAGLENKSSISLGPLQSKLIVVSMENY